MIRAKPSFWGSIALGFLGAAAALSLPYFIPADRPGYARAREFAALAMFGPWFWCLARVALLGGVKSAILAVVFGAGVGAIRAYWVLGWTFTMAQTPWLAGVVGLA